MPRKCQHSKHFQESAWFSFAPRKGGEFITVVTGRNPIMHRNEICDIGFFLEYPTRSQKAFTAKVLD